jgi:NAD-dependent deacetylase
MAQRAGIQLNIVILTGAGISAESGLGTFRDTDGLWSRYNIEDVATPKAFARNPVLVHEFYNLRRQAMRAATPNAAHFALAELEQNHKGGFCLVTQNVDDLHHRAGSEYVLAMHGALQMARCADCNLTWHAPDQMSATDKCQVCGGGRCRPDVVWFDEQVRFLDEIIAVTKAADLFVMIGTSANVHPAASLMALARRSGAVTIEFNLEPSSAAGSADDVILGPATLTVPEWLSKGVAQGLRTKPE